MVDPTAVFPLRFHQQGDEKPPKPKKSLFNPLSFLFKWQKNAKEKDQSAIKIQALYRGYRVRKRSYTFRQMNQLLARALPSSMDEWQISALSFCVCREVNERGGKRGWISTKRVYPLLRAEGVSLEFKMPRNCFLSVTGKCVNLILADRLLGVGGFKTVLGSYHLVLPHSTVKTVDCYPKVLSTVRGVEKVRRVKKGIAFQEYFYLKGLPIAEAPITLMEDRLSKTLQAMRKFYSGTLSEAMSSSGILTGYQSDQRVRMSFAECVEVSITIAKALIAMHKDGYVHCDVTPHNILISYKGGAFKGVLSDFDLVRRIGAVVEGRDYFYWDFLAKSGVITPLCDLYGLAMTLGEVVFGGKFAGFLQWPEVIVESGYDRMLHNFLYKMAMDLTLNSNRTEQLLGLDREDTFSLSHVREMVERSDLGIDVGDFWKVSSFLVDCELIVEIHRLIRRVVAMDLQIKDSRSALHLKNRMTRYRDQKGVRRQMVVDFLAAYRLSLQDVCVDLQNATERWKMRQRALKHRRASIVFHDLLE